MHIKSSVRLFTLGLGLLLSTNTLFAADNCAAGKTLKDGTLTIATGNPAYSPWVVDNKPESGEAFEAAVADELAKRMGFEKDKVVWTTGRGV